MRLNRRTMLAACAATVPALGASRSEPAGGQGPLGLVIHSFPVRNGGDRGRKSQDRFSEPARFLDYARSLGARGVQVGLGTLNDTAADALRERASAASMYLEGIVSLPRDQADTERFEAEIRAASCRRGKLCGRSCSGRRYETFTTAAAFRRFVDTSSHGAEPGRALRRRADTTFYLAVENHKDSRGRVARTLETSRQRGRRGVPRHRQEHRTFGRPNGGGRNRSLHGRSLLT